MSFTLAKYLPQAVSLPVWVTLPIEKIQALPLAASIPIVGTLAFGICQFYRFFVKPALSVAFYKRQGLIGGWSPFWGFLKQLGLDLQAKGDMLWSWKQVNYIKPKPRAFVSNFAEKPVVALKDPELIKDFFAKQEQYYIKLPDAVAIPKIILRNGTLLAEGNTWKAHRKLSGPLYSYDTAKMLIPDIIKIAEERFEALREKGIKKINFMTEIQHIQLEIAGRVFLGLELHKLEFKGQTVSGFVAELIDRAALESFNPFTLFFTHKIVETKLHPRHKKLVQDIEDLRNFLFGAAKTVLGGILADKESGASKGKKPLLLELIYDQLKKHPEGEVDAVDLVDEFANFVLGFMNTTSHANTFGSYFILSNPAVHKKLLDEVDRTFKDASTVNIDTLNEMDYLTAVMKETLRMAPPLPNFLPRLATKDHKLGDINIKAGTVISVAGSTNSFDPDYHDEPERFSPERWLDENSRTRKSVAKNPYIYIPFSTGHRVCSGQVLGQNLYKIILAVFVKKYNYSLADKSYKMGFGAKLFAEPSEALIYTIEPRLT